MEGCGVGSDRSRRSGSALAFRPCSRGGRRMWWGRRGCTMRRKWFNGAIFGCRGCRHADSPVRPTALANSAIPATRAPSRAGIHVDLVLSPVAQFLAFFLLIFLSFQVLHPVAGPLRAQDLAYTAQVDPPSDPEPAPEELRGALQSVRPPCPLTGYQSRHSPTGNPFPEGLFFAPSAPIPIPAARLV